MVHCASSLHLWRADWLARARRWGLCSSLSQPLPPPTHPPWASWGGGKRLAGLARLAFCLSLPRCPCNSVLRSHQRLTRHALLARRQLVRHDPREALQLAPEQLVRRRCRLAHVPARRRGRHVDQRRVERQRGQRGQGGRADGRGPGQAARGSGSAQVGRAGTESSPGASGSSLSACVPSLTLDKHDSQPSHPRPPPLAFAIDTPLRSRLCIFPPPASPRQHTRLRRRQSTIPTSPRGPSEPRTLAAPAPPLHIPLATRRLASPALRRRRLLILGLKGFHFGFKGVFTSSPFLSLVVVVVWSPARRHLLGLSSPRRRPALLLSQRSFPRVFTVLHPGFPCPLKSLSRSSSASRLRPPFLSLFALAHVPLSSASPDIVRVDSVKQGEGDRCVGTTKWVRDGGRLRGEAVFESDVGAAGRVLSLSLPP